MTEIYPLELKKGITYRIVHKNDQIEEQVGVFDRLVGIRPNVNAMFTDIRGEKIFPADEGAYRTDEWKFLKHDDPGDPQPVADGGRRRRKTKKSKRRSRKTRRSRK